MIRSISDPDALLVKIIKFGEKLSTFFDVFSSQILWLVLQIALHEIYFST